MNIEEALKEKGKVTVRGWVREIRDLKKIKFIVLTDGMIELQVLIKNATEKMNKTVDDLSKESYIEITGVLKDSDKAKLGKEMIPDSIKVLAKSEQPFPIDISGRVATGLDKRLDWRFLDMRRPEVLKVFKLQSNIVRYISEYAWDNGFTRIFSSKLVGSPTEGGTEYFELKYFDKMAFMAQSPQFYKEMALLSGLNKVFELGMVYRAEPHHTSRHLCEYTSFDFEMVADKMEEIMSFEEDALRYTFKKLGLEFPKRIPRIHFDEAVKVVEKMGIKTEEGDLTPAGERALCEWSKNEKKSDFVFLTNFPWDHKVFYAKKKGKVDSESFDLLYRGVEITTGGLREEDPVQRAKNAEEKGLESEQFDHLRFFKYGMPAHGGLAIGVERFTQLILGLENIREASLTPRDPSRLSP